MLISDKEKKKKEKEEWEKNNAYLLKGYKLFLSLRGRIRVCVCDPLENCTCEILKYIFQGIEIFGNESLSGLIKSSDAKC